MNHYQLSRRRSASTRHGVATVVGGRQPIRNRRGTNARENGCRARAAKWRVGVSIPLPTACEAVALPFELTPQNRHSVPRRHPVCRPRGAWRRETACSTRAEQRQSGPGRWRIVPNTFRAGSAVGKRAVRVRAAISGLARLAPLVHHGPGNFSTGSAHPPRAVSCSAVWRLLVVEQPATGDQSTNNHPPK